MSRRVTVAGDTDNRGRSDQGSDLRFCGLVVFRARISCQNVSTLIKDSRVTLVDPPQICAYCGNALPQKSGPGRKRRFCRDACRTAAARHGRRRHDDVVRCTTHFGQNRTGWGCDNPADGNVVIKPARPLPARLSGDPLHSDAHETLICDACRRLCEQLLTRQGFKPIWRPLLPWERYWSTRKKHQLDRSSEVKRRTRRA